MVRNELQEAIGDENGGLVDITRIELVPLADGEIRWNLFGVGGRRLFSAVGQQSDLPAMMRSTECILQVMGGSYRPPFGIN